MTFQKDKKQNSADEEQDKKSTSSQHQHRHHHRRHRRHGKDKAKATDTQGNSLLVKEADDQKGDRRTRSVEGSGLKCVDSECERMTQKLLMKHYASLSKFLKKRDEASGRKRGSSHRRHGSSRNSGEKSSSSRHKDSESHRRHSTLSNLTQHSNSSDFSREYNKLKKSYNAARHCYESKEQSGQDALSHHHDCKSKHGRHHGAQSIRKADECSAGSLRSRYSEQSHVRAKNFPIVRNWSESTCECMYTKNKSFMRAVKHASSLRRQGGIARESRQQDGDGTKTDLNILYCSAGELRNVLQRVARRMAQEGWKPPPKKSTGDNNVPAVTGPVQQNKPKEVLESMSSHQHRLAPQAPLGDAPPSIPIKVPNTPPPPPPFPPTATPQMPHPPHANHPSACPMSCYPNHSHCLQRPNPYPGTPATGYSYYSSTATPHYSSPFQMPISGNYPYDSSWQDCPYKFRGAKLWNDPRPPGLDHPWEKPMAPAGFNSNSLEEELYKSLQKEWTAPTNSFF